MSNTLRLPDGFLWGAATAAHQVEGGNWNSDWWQLEHLPNSPCTESSGDACDHYHRFRQDMELLADSGLNAYRFSLEWARIEPAPGEFSRVQLEHYRTMIDAALECGLTPMVTLQHFTLPRWFADDGGWMAPDAVDRFSAYVGQVCSILGPVPYVVTINEPNMAAMVHGADRQASLDAAGLPGPNPEVSATLIRAHHRVRDTVRAQTDAQVGWSIANQDYQAAPGCQAQRDAYAQVREDVFLRACAGDDFVGVQAYLRTIIGENGPLDWPEGTERTLTGWEYYPPALGHAVAYTRSIVGQIPMIVTENGIATADDSRRIDYTTGALAGLAAQMVAGADVRGYLHWSALDNFEWMSGFAPTFGLIAVDRNALTRNPRPSLAWLGQWARRNELPV